MKLDREDIDGFLWLQQAVEHVLKEETERRAHAAGRVPEGGNLWRVEVSVGTYTPHLIEVSYEVASPRPPRGLRESTTYTEEYTLAEALALCLAPPTNSPASE